MFRKIRRYMNDPYYALGYDMIKDHPNWMSDKFYLKVLWRMVMGYELDLKNPQTFNEKLQWLKLYDHNPLYTLLVDKYRVKDWVKERIGEQYVIPTLAVYNSADEIQLESLPKQFVLKCNHDSGSVIICKDKECFDIFAAKEKLQNALDDNFYFYAREWPYKNVKPVIIAEPYLEDKKAKELPDYKFFCFDGEAKVLFIATNRQNANDETRFDFFDMQFNHINVTNGHPNADVLPVKPECFDEMALLAAKLSVGLPQVRVDFYQVNGKVYFGEMTLFHFGGAVPFNPSSFDYELGEYLHLPKR